MCVYGGVRGVQIVRRRRGRRMGKKGRRVKSYSVLAIPLVSCSYVSYNKSVL